MKKYIGLFAFLMLVCSLAVAGVASAADSTSGSTGSSTTTPKKTTGEVKNNLKAAKTELQKLTADQKSQMAAFKKTLDTERKALQDKIKSERAAFLTQINTEKAQWKKQTSDQKNQFLVNAQGIIGQQFTEAIQKLTDAQTSIGTAIDTLKAAGKDTTNATADLNLSKQNLTDATKKLDAAKALLPTDGTKMTADVFAQVKLAVRDARDLLKQSRENLLLAIKEIRNLNGDNTSGSSDQNPPTGGTGTSTSATTQ